MSTNLKIIKRKETYRIYNLSSEVGYYSIGKKSCSSSEEVVNGNITANSSFTFTPSSDGEYLLTITLTSSSESVIITHYPTLIKSIVKDIEKALFNFDSDCCENEDC